MLLPESQLAALKRSLGFSAHEYRKADGLYIGYEHKLQPGEHYPHGITQADAEELLIRDVTAGRITFGQENSIENGPDAA